MREKWKSFLVAAAGFFRSFSIKEGWSKAHKALIYLFILILVVMLIFSFTLFKTERVIERETITQETSTGAVSITSDSLAKIINENSTLTAENSRLAKEKQDLQAKVLSISREKDDLLSEKRRLIEVIDDLETREGSLVVAPIPAPTEGVMIWTSFQALDLMRSTWPGTNKSRIPVFSEAPVYSLEFYKELLPFLSQHDNNQPAAIARWLVARYPTVAGFIYTPEYGYRTLLPLVANNEVALYYENNGELLPITESSSMMVATTIVLFR
jgi:hypothetical protein